MSKQMDVIEVYTQLQKKFPYVEFEIIETEKKLGFSRQKFHEFRLKRLYNQVFEKPIKTSINIRQGATIDTNDYYSIEDKMYESFGKYKKMEIV